jgi:hypothetical protein
MMVKVLLGKAGKVNLREGSEIEEGVCSLEKKD